MYLILALDDKKIMHISTTLDYDMFEGYVIDSGLHIVKGISEAVEVDEIPSNVEVEKYCYINNEFVENVNYVEFIEENHRNPSAYNEDEQSLYNKYVSYTRSSNLSEEEKLFLKEHNIEVREVNICNVD